MKRLKQRILAGVLAFVMCISTVNVTAFAQENETTSKSQEIIAISEAGSENEASTENIEITDTSVSGNNVKISHVIKSIKKWRMKKFMKVKIIMLHFR